MSSRESYEAAQSSEWWRHDCVEIQARHDRYKAALGEIAAKRCATVFAGDCRSQYQQGDWCTRCVARAALGEK